MLYNMVLPHDQPAASSRPLLKPPARPKRVQHAPLPFDPDDLSRRLTAVLAEQSARADRKKRRTRADPSKYTKTPFVKEGSAPVPQQHGSQTGEPASNSVPATLSSSGLKKSSSSRQASLQSGELRKSRSGRDKPSRKHAAAAAAAAKPSSKEDQDDETSSTGHYVPKVAAQQFARTTTAHDMAQQSLVHKISRKALKFHLGGPSHGPAASSSTPGAAAAAAAPSATTSTDPNAVPSCDHSNGSAPGRSKSQRNMMFERSQFLRQKRILEAPTETDGDLTDHRNSKHQHRHTFEGPLPGGVMGRPDEFQTVAALRRASTSEIAAALDSSDATPPPPPAHDADSSTTPEIPPHDVNEHRVDWTQSDETYATRPLKARTAPLLRKADSIWTLKARLGSLAKGGHGRLEKAPPRIREEEWSAEGGASKASRAGFFARFKVNH